MYRDNSNWYYKGYQLSIGNGEIISAFTKNHMVSGNTNNTIKNQDLKEFDYIDITLNLFARRLTFNFIGEGKANLEITIQNIKKTRYRLALSGLFCKSSEFALIK